jgi:anti-sigma factor RsiW
VAKRFGSGHRYCHESDSLKDGLKVVDCKDCRTLLVDYERGELDVARDAAMYAHLTACEDCRAEWHADLALVDALRSSADEREFPMSVLVGVRQAMHAEPAPSLVQRLRVFLRPVIAAPVAAAVILTGVFVGYQQSRTPQPTLTGMDFVREHVAQTASLPSSDRTWSTYVLTSVNAGDTVNADNSADH